MQSTAFAGALEVAPTTISLQPSGRTAVIHIANRDTTPIYAQVEAFDWNQVDSKEALTPSKNLLVSPPMTRLLPGQRQTVRLMVNTSETEQKEKTFRLVVSELPDPTVKKEGVQILLQFVIPVFFENAAKTAPMLECSTKRNAEEMNVTLHNAGERHLKLSKIELNIPGAQAMSVSSAAFNYILAGADYQWSLKDVPPSISSNPLTVTAQDERDGKLQATCRMTP